LQGCFILDYSECSKYYRIYNFGNLDFWTNLSVWFDDKLVSDETKLLKNFCRYSLILSKAEKSSFESPEAVFIYIRSEESEVPPDLYQCTSEGVFPEEKLDHFRSNDQNLKA